MNKIEYFHRFFELSSNKDETYVTCPICGYKFNIKNTANSITISNPIPSNETFINYSFFLEHCNERISVIFLNFEEAKRKYDNLENMNFQDYWAITINN